MRLLSFSPNLPTPRELITYLHSLDANGDGALSFTELNHALYALDLGLPDGRRVRGRFVPK